MLISTIKNFNLFQIFSKTYAVDCIELSTLDFENYIKLIDFKIRPNSSTITPRINLGKIYYRDMTTNVINSQATLQKISQTSPIICSNVVEGITYNIEINNVNNITKISADIYVINQFTCRTFIFFYRIFTIKKFIFIKLKKKIFIYF